MFLASLDGFGRPRAGTDAGAGGGAGGPGRPPRLAAMRGWSGRRPLRRSATARPASLKLRDEPLLHYGDPGRGIREGTLWAWSGRGRPAAVMKIEYWSGGARRGGTLGPPC